MSFALTATIIFGVVFAIALFIGFVYEKELSEFERIVFRFIRLKIEAKKAGMTVEEYVKAKKRNSKKINTKEKAFSNVIYLDNWVA